MGLGPSMCLKCRVWSKFSDENGWHCEFCNSQPPYDNIGYFNENRPSDDELDSNYRFYKFFKNL